MCQRAFMLFPTSFFFSHLLNLCELHVYANQRKLDISYRLPTYQNRLNVSSFYELVSKGKTMADGKTVVQVQLLLFIVKHLIML